MSSWGNRCRVRLVGLASIRGIKQTIDVRSNFERTGFFLQRACCRRVRRSEVAPILAYLAQVRAYLLIFLTTLPVLGLDPIENDGVECILFGAVEKPLCPSVERSACCRNGNYVGPVRARGVFK